MTPLDRARQLIALRQKATAGEWFSVATDDDSFMNARYVGTVDRGGRHDHKQGMSDGREDEIIAITLVQASNTPACHESEKWDENTDFIAAAGPAAVVGRAQRCDDHNDSRRRCSAPAAQRTIRLDRGQIGRAHV